MHLNFSYKAPCRVRQPRRRPCRTAFAREPSRGRHHVWPVGGTAGPGGHWGPAVSTVTGEKVPPELSSAGTWLWSRWQRSQRPHPGLPSARLGGQRLRVPTPGSCHSIAPACGRPKGQAGPQATQRTAEGPLCVEAVSCVRGEAAGRSLPTTRTHTCPCWPEAGTLAGPPARPAPTGLRATSPQPTATGLPAQREGAGAAGPPARNAAPPAGAPARRPRTWRLPSRLLGGVRALRSHHRRL